MPDAVIIAVAMKPDKQGFIDELSRYFVIIDESLTDVQAANQILNKIYTI